MTDPGTLVVEPLGRPHDRKAFSCDLPELDRYLSRQVGQDVRRRIARVFVSTAADGGAVLGFYTLSALSIELSALPEELSRKLPLHPVPCVLLGRPAVDRSVHGRGVGRMLLADAVRRVVAAGETVAMHAMIVDAANDDAKRFHEGFGFMPWWTGRCSSRSDMPLFAGRRNRSGHVPHPPIMQSAVQNVRRDAAGNPHRGFPHRILRQMRVPCSCRHLAMTEQLPDHWKRFPDRQCP